MVDAFLDDGLAVRCFRGLVVASNGGHFSGDRNISIHFPFKERQWRDARPGVVADGTDAEGVSIEGAGSAGRATAGWLISRPELPRSRDEAG